MHKMVKKIFYIFAFMLLGIITSLLLHGALELGVIALLEHDFEHFNLGLGWREWFAIHYYGSAALHAIGAFAGLQQGLYWWSIIYPEQQKNEA